MEPQDQPNLGQPRADTSLEQPRYASLSDYLRVVRRHKRLIALFTVLFAAAGLGLALAQTASYDATAQLSFNDFSEILGLEGQGQVVPTTSPSVRASVAGEVVTSQPVAARVQKKLHTNLSTDDLESAVSTQVGTTTGLLAITASATDAKLAARIANAYAHEAQRIGSAQQEHQLNRLEQTLRDELAKAPKSRFPGVQTTEQTALTLALSRVHQAEAIAEPVKIAEPASVPQDPSGAPASRSAVVGGILGLVFGLLAAFARDSLDRRLHTAHEVHEELGFPVLGRVPDHILGIGGLARNGRRPMTDRDFESFRGLRMNLGVFSPESPIRVVLVTSGLAEEGKSTVSMSLASASAFAGQRTLLIEGDLRRPTFAKRLGVERAPGLSDYLQGNAAPQEILQVVDLAAPVPGEKPSSLPRSQPSAGTLVCIAAGSPVTNPAELLASERFEDLLTKVRKLYDLVIVDSGPVLAVVDPLTIMPMVDCALVCVRVQATTKEQARATKSALGNLPPRPMGAVITGIKHGGPDSYDYYYGY